MTNDLLGLLIPCAAVLLAMAFALAWLERTADLKLSLFRPYRGDSWPVGVQEDDDVRFDWSAARSDGRADDTGGDATVSVPVERLEEVVVRGITR